MANARCMRAAQVQARGVDFTPASSGRAAGGAAEAVGSGSTRPAHTLSPQLPHLLDREPRQASFDQPTVKRMSAAVVLHPLLTRRLNLAAIVVLVIAGPCISLEQ